MTHQDSIEEAVRDICNVSVTTASKSEVRRIITKLCDSAIKEERARVVKIVHEWIDKGYELPTLLDRLDTLAVDDTFTNLTKEE